MRGETSMKAFTLYPQQEIYLRQLLRKIQDYGTMNCDFEAFSKLYEKWHLESFPGRPVDAKTATFRDDWFRSFVGYLANSEL